MRKAKTAGDTAVMEMSQSSLGVRTRAKTLALQRLQSTAASTAAPENPDSCYLELRSRRLEKQQPQQQHNSRKGRCRSCVCQGQEYSEECCEAASISCSIGAAGLGIEASFGENNFDTEARGRYIHSLMQLLLTHVNQYLCQNQHILMILMNWIEISNYLIS